MTNDMDDVIEHRLVKMRRRTFRETASYLIAKCADKGQLLDHLEAAHNVALEEKGGRIAVDLVQLKESVATGQAGILVAVPFAGGTLTTFILADPDILLVGDEYLGAMIGKVLARTVKRAADQNRDKLPTKEEG